jgi:hypothetical protein
MAFQILSWKKESDKQKIENKGWLFDLYSDFFFSDVVCKMQLFTVYLENNKSSG